MVFSFLLSLYWRLEVRMIDPCGDHCLFTRLLCVVRPPPAALGSDYSPPWIAGEGARAT
jgi:hypothetical protein